MSKFSEKFLFLNSFVNGFKDFDKYFLENDEKIDSPEFNELFKKLYIMQSFLIAIEKINKEQTEFLADKIEKDEDIFKKKLVEMLNENNPGKNTWMFDRYSNTVTQFIDDNDNFKLVSSESDDDIDDNSSISSLDDINSQDSEIDEKGNEEEQKENELVNRMFAKSLVEFNMRKETKDLRADKVE
jgi:hypothetical protein